MMGDISSEGASSNGPPEVYADSLERERYDPALRPLALEAQAAGVPLSAIQDICLEDEPESQMK